MPVSYVTSNPDSHNAEDFSDFKNDLIENNWSVICSPCLWLPPVRCLGIPHQLPVFC